MKVCPITGKQCEKQQCYKVTDLQNNTIIKYEVCEDCVNKPITNQPQFADNDLSELAKLFDSILSKKLFDSDLESNSQEDKNDRKCPNCQLTTNEFIELGKLGCSECYDYFKNDIEGFVKYYHNALQHQGKVPKSNQSIDPVKYIMELKEKLQKSIEREDYETASDCRDKITAMEALHKRLEEATFHKDEKQAELLRNTIADFIQRDKQG